MKKFGLYFSTGTLLLTMAFSQVKDPLNLQQLKEIYSSSPENWPEPSILEGVVFEEIGKLPTNPYQNNKELEDIVMLGKTLFFDPRLSSSNQISCASCHDPELSFSNGRSVAIGRDHILGSRNVQAIENIWNREVFFWDGRAVGLEEQTLMPIADHIEMNQNLEELPDKIASIKGYLALFEKAFGNQEVDNDKIAKALATFQRSLTSRKSDFDYFMEGKHERMSEEAIYGMHLFRTKAQCINCHSGPLFTDDKFHNLGLHFYGRKHQDLGRYEITKDPKDVGAFKTPSLRNVKYTGPYMHNGLFPTLEGVVEMYSNGMARPKPRPEFENDPLFPETSPLVHNLQLTKEEKKALIAFLESISAPPFRMSRPELPQ